MASDVIAPASCPRGAVADAFAARIDADERARQSPLATLSASARRSRAEADCTLRTPFQRDRDRIVHAKAFRRLKHKTQVFIAPEGDHYRTRLTHTLEVSGIARTVARALRLNEDLTEAVALGHDLGHPPFGHTGEEALADAHARVTGRRFRHNEHSLRVVDVLERDGRGLNLTDDVRDGILNHTGPVAPRTLEARIVKLVDRFAYINHDVDDAVRAGILDPAELPAAAVSLLGATASERIDALVHDLVERSERAGAVVQSAAHEAAMLDLRAFMFEAIYLRPASEPERRHVAHVVSSLYTHFAAAETFPGRIAADVPRSVVDHVAGMTDRYALATYRALNEPDEGRR